jgi:hypothetical protein
LQLFVQLLLDEVTSEKRPKPQTNYCKQAHTVRLLEPQAKWPRTTAPIARPHARGPFFRP